MSASQTLAQNRPNVLLDAYVRQAGVYDEMLDADGVVKPAWAGFMAHLGGLTPDELSRRFTRGDQYLRDAGVLYRQYDDTVSTEREWPLSHIPFILGEEEWEAISQGLIQRADLLEYVVRDFYGANELVSSGQIPAALLGQNAAWLRPMIGTHPTEDPFLNFLSFEIGRGPDGKWWVISDIVESPTTAGFALENRVAVSRVFPNFYAHANVQRIAGFFQAIQQNLYGMKGRAKGQIAVLTPGQMNQNYAEHAYLARYLGLLLVEGEDLIVSNGEVMVRTVAGPRPLSLLWNRVPDAMIDPIELESSSLLGTPGLLDAVRRGRLKTWNAVGAGVLETRALMAFLPKIARKRLGQGLSIPNIATWWCGHEAERAHVIAHYEQMMIGSAFSTVPLIADPGTLVFEAGQQGAVSDQIKALLQQSGRELVGQEAVTLSTTPVFEDGALVARPSCLRVFLVRDGNGWQVMPGGYARVSAGNDTKAFAMQRGGRVADVWVASKSPVRKTSLLGAGSVNTKQKVKESALPSRAADNLYWVGRNVERAELNMRLCRAYFARVADGFDSDEALLRHIRTKLMRIKSRDPGKMIALFATPLDNALLAATKISDRFSPDGMKSLKEIVGSTAALRRTLPGATDLPSDMSLLLRQITGFSGLVHENMYRSDGWRFLSLGTSLERAANMVQLLCDLTGPSAPDGAFDLALELGDSVVSHRARFSVLAHADSVLDLLALDVHNPRSVRYHVTRAKQHIAEFPGQTHDQMLGSVARHVLKLETELATATSDMLTPKTLSRMKQDLWSLSDVLTDAYLV